MTNLFGIHLEIPFRTLPNFELAIKSIDMTKVKTIWLRGDLNDLKSHCDEINLLLSDFNVLVENDIELALSLSAKAILLKDPDDIQEIKKQHHNLKIGVVTNEVVDCKNAELFKADFVYLGPYQKIGFEPYESLTPKEPPYEWMILNIIIPVFAFGNFNQKTLNKMDKHIKLGGIALKLDDFESLSTDSLIFNA